MPVFRRISKSLVELRRADAWAPIIYGAGHAGAGVHWAIDLVAGVPKEWGVRAILLPGREARFAEPFAESVAAIAAQAAAEISNLHPSSHSLILFGQSLGALVTFETCRILEHDPSQRPRALCVVGAPAPNLPQLISGDADSDEALTAELVRIGATPAEVLNDDGLREMTLRVVRSDVRLYASYPWQTSAVVSVPVIAVRGTADGAVSPEAADAWRHSTCAEFTSVVVEGGHLVTRAAGRACARALVAGTRSV